MSTIVDLRPGRIGAACARAFDEPEQPVAAGRLSTAHNDGAEIILFPRVSPARAQRPRKRVTRRFNWRDQRTATRSE